MYSELKNIVNIDNIKFDEEMKKHTSFKVGGKVDVLITPSDEEELISLIKYLKEKNINYLIVGNGSNLLVKDGGFRGVIIKITNKFNKFEIKGEYVDVQSGVILSTISKAFTREGLSGFEFAAGIPGTIGGAIYMNAGAYGGEMKDIVQSVRLLDEDGNIFELSNSEMEFSYRKSVLANKNYIVLSSKMKLKKSCSEIIRNEIRDATQKRVANQPLNMPSAGSTFKRPEGFIAAKLIDDAGLKGLSMGGAQVSTKHSGFIVNTGDATCEDILNLMYIVKTIVKDKFNVELEPEVKILGED
ncbi:MAG: UDP-N-acetylmuramate dehydrogenase [Peptostreptococcaceae bacterium]